MQDKHPGGRPTKFTAEHKEKIIYAIRKGAPYELACNYAGISYRTFMYWMAAARRGENEEFLQFMQTLQQAEGETVLYWLSKVDEAMEDGKWNAATWKLERRHSKYFSDQAGVIALNERVDNIEEDKHAQGKGSTQRYEGDEEDGASHREESGSEG